MNKKGQGAIVGMAIGAILLVVILAVIFSTLSNQISADTTTITADQFTADNTSCVRVTQNCIVTLTTVVNATNADGIEATGNYSACDISGDASGIALSPDDADGNIDNNGFTANATYNERSCAFITSGTTRTLVALIPVLLAIAILIFILGFMTLRK